MRVFTIYTLLTLSLSSFTQDNIAEIRKYYYGVSERIKSCSDTSVPCGYYSDVLEINRQDQPWRAVGTFTKKTTFWYYDDPHHCENCHEDQTVVLERVEVKEYISVYEIYTEYTYKEGDLIFIFRKGDYRDPDCEHRIYLQGSEVIKYLSNKEGKDLCEKMESFEDLIKTAEYYQDIFILNHK